MRPAIRTAALAAALALTLTGHPALAQTLSTHGTIAWDVSANGTVVYSAGGSASLWAMGSGNITPLGAASTTGRMIISDDGTRIAGSTVNASTGKLVSAYYSTATGSWTQLSPLGGSIGSTAQVTWAMSSGGRYIAGNSYTAVGNYSHAVVTDTSTGVITDIGPAGNVQSRVNGISTDGKVAFGYNTNSRYGSVWRDPEGDGSYAQTILTHPVGGGNTSEGVALSDNGLWAAGASFNTALPYFVDITTGVVSTFPKLPFNDGSPSQKSVATPSVISEDGQLIIGTHSILGGLNTNRGFIWTAPGGVQEIDTYFAQNGIDTANAYNFVSPLAMRVQADGSTAFVGIAIDLATGGQVGFAVDIPAAPVPEPASAATLLGGLGGLAFVLRRRRSATRG